jgi:protein O-GlcNAc transferase
MNYHRFAKELPSLYMDWASDGVSPRSERFQQVLRRVQGMTSVNVLQLLNFAVACLEEGEGYGEIGCFQGATLIGALLDHPDCRAYAVDNFSEFDAGGKNRASLHDNLAAFGLLQQVSFHDVDFQEFLLGLGERRSRLGVYLYDGCHDYRSQLLGLLLARPLLADRALLVIDDANCPSVQQATWDFLAAEPACRLLFELPTPGNCHPSFWNGVFVLSWERGTSGRHEWPTFKARRQTALLESLDVLQSVTLKRQGNLIAIGKA